jgi:hypothetical protein
VVPTEGNENILVIPKVIGSEKYTRTNNKEDSAYLKTESVASGDIRAVSGESERRSHTWLG